MPLIARPKTNKIAIVCSRTVLASMLPSNYWSVPKQRNIRDMRRPARTRRKIFGLILAICITMIPPYIVFGADRTPRSSGRLKAPKPPPQRAFPQRFQPFGLWGAGGVGQEQTIIIQQVQSATSSASSESREAATNRIYVPPRWADGGHGVQVSVPGYWADANQAPKR